MSADSRRRSVIFDCDGVLVDSEPIVNRLEAELITELGISCTPEDAKRRFMGKTVAGVADALAQELGRPLPSEWSYNWGMATALRLALELKSVAGVEVAVRTLWERGIPMAVASQSPLARIALSLRTCGLDGFFGTHIYAASMVERPKPAPDLFLLAARGLATSPESCVVIEDSPSGVAAAVAAGMACYGYAAAGSASELRAAGAHGVFAEMRELPPLLREIGVLLD